MRLRGGRLPASRRTDVGRLHKQPELALKLRPHCRTTPSRALKSQTQTQTESKHQEVLQSLLPLDDRGLRDWLRDDGNRNRVSLDFLFWLAGRLDAADEQEKGRLDELGGKLTALREGTDSTAATEWLEALRESPATSASSTAGTEGADLELQIQIRQQELARRKANEALSLSQLNLGHQKAAELGKELEDRRANSVAQIIGRSPVELSQAERGLSAAGAADRILATLLSIPDPQERLATLPEAFTPPQPGTQETAEEELLHTTPMRLLQAIAVAASRVRKGGDIYGEYDTQLALAGAKPMSPEQLLEALEQLKHATFRCWEKERRL